MCNVTSQYVGELAKYQKGPARKTPPHRCEHPPLRPTHPCRCTGCPSLPLPVSGARYSHTCGNTTHHVTPTQHHVTALCSCLRYARVTASQEVVIYVLVPHVTALCSHHEGQTIYVLAPQVTALCSSHHHTRRGRHAHAVFSKGVAINVHHNPIALPCTGGFGRTTIVTTNRPVLPGCECHCWQHINPALHLAPCSSSPRLH